MIAAATVAILLLTLVLAALAYVGALLGALMLDFFTYLYDLYRYPGWRQTTILWRACAWLRRKVAR